MKKQLILFGIVFLLLLVGLSGCIGEDITGEWKSENIDIRVIFDNGNFKQDYEETPVVWDFEGTYNYDGSTLELYYEFVTELNETIEDIKDIYNVEWIDDNTIKFSIKSYDGWEILGINQTFWKE
jgi:hypothetical protein